MDVEEDENSTFIKSNEDENKNLNPQETEKESIRTDEDEAEAEAEEQQQSKILAPTDNLEAIFVEAWKTQEKPFNFAKKLKNYLEISTSQDPKSEICELFMEYLTFSPMNDTFFSYLWHCLHLNVIPVHSFLLKAIDYIESQIKSTSSFFFDRIYFWQKFDTILLAMLPEIAQRFSQREDFSLHASPQKLAKKHFHYQRMHKIKILSFEDITDSTLKESSTSKRTRDSSSSTEQQQKEPAIQISTEQKWKCFQETGYLVVKFFHFQFLALKNFEIKTMELQSSQKLQPSKRLTIDKPSEILKDCLVTSYRAILRMLKQESIALILSICRNSRKILPSFF